MPLTVMGENITLHYSIWNMGNIFLNVYINIILGISDVFTEELRYTLHILSSVFDLFASGDSLSVRGVSIAFLFLRGTGSDLRDCCFSCVRGV